MARKGRRLRELFSFRISTGEGSLRHDQNRIDPSYYSWEELVQFVEELREDSSAVSKGRLMSMHLRMQGMRTRNGDKELISLYRGRNRDLWPIGLQQQYATEQRQEREREASNRRAMDSWDVQDEPMTERQIQAAQRQLDDVHRR